MTKYQSGEEAKVGDVVVSDVTRHGINTTLRAGQRYEVLTITKEEGVVVDKKDQGGGWSAENFKLVSRAAPKVEAKPERSYPRYFTSNINSATVSHLEIREPGGRQVMILQDGREQTAPFSFLNEAIADELASKGKFVEVFADPRTLATAPPVAEAACAVQEETPDFAPVVKYPRYFIADAAVYKRPEISHFEIRTPGGPQFCVYNDGREEDVTKVPGGSHCDEVQMRMFVSSGDMREVFESPLAKKTPEAPKPVPTYPRYARTQVAFLPESAQLTYRVNAPGEPVEMKMDGAAEWLRAPACNEHDIFVLAVERGIVRISDGELKVEPVAGQGDAFAGYGEDKQAFEARRDAAELTLRNEGYTHKPGSSIWSAPLVENAVADSERLDEFTVRRAFAAEKSKRYKLGRTNATLQQRLVEAEKQVRDLPARIHNLEKSRDEHAKHADKLHGLLKNAHEELKKLGPNAGKNAYAIKQCARLLNVAEDGDAVGKALAKLMNGVGTLRNLLLSKGETDAAYTLQKLLEGEDVKLAG